MAKIKKKKELTSNLVRTRTGTTNITDYVSFAAGETPYLISTYERYIMLKKERAKIVSRATKGHRPNFALAIAAMANKAFQNEQKQLSKMAADMGLSGPDDLVNRLNETMNEAREFNNTLNEAINIVADLMASIQENDPGVIYEDILESMKEYDSALDLIDLGGEKRNSLSKKSPVKIEQVIKAYDSLVQKVNKPDMFVSDIKSANMAMGMMSDILATAENQASKDALRTYAGTYQYNTMKSELDSAKRKVENIFEKRMGKTLLYGGSSAGTGRAMSGVLVDHYLSEAMAALANKKNRNATAANKRLIDGAIEQLVDQTFTTKGISSGAIKNTVSLGYEIEGQSAIKASIDVKYSTQRNIKKLKAKSIYQTSVVVDFGKEFQRLMSKSDGEYADQLYRSLVLNIALNEGYMLGPEERTMLLGSALAYGGAERQFQLADGSFPLLASLNGELVRFSLIMGQLGNSMFDTVQKEMAAGSWGNKLQPGFDIDQQELYEEKVIEGDGQMIADFSDLVDGARLAAIEIEKSYRELGKKKMMIKFKVK